MGYLVVMMFAACLALWILTMGSSPQKIYQSGLPPILQPA